MLLEKDPTQVIWESLKLQTIWSHLGLFYYRDSLYKYIYFCRNFESQLFEIMICSAEINFRTLK